MRVCVHQTSPVLLDVETNVEEVVGRIRRAKDNGVQLSVFPELALTGYFVGQKYHQVALRHDSPQLARITEATQGTAAVVGFIEESPSMLFYNSALVAADGEIRLIYRKLNLPNYGVFEERKYFSHGSRISVFELGGYKLAVLICNDLWHPSLPYLAVVQSADIFLTLFNSSDTAMGKEFSNIESWRIVNKFYSRVFGIYNICANRVGEEVWESHRSFSAAEAAQLDYTDAHDLPAGEHRFRFWGGSEIIDPFGKSIAEAKLYEPDKIVADLSRELLRRKKILLPYLRGDDPYFTHRELERILYHPGRAPKP